MAMTYDQYKGMYGSFFDPVSEEEAINRNVQDPILRAQILNQFRATSPQQAAFLRLTPSPAPVPSPVPAPAPAPQAVPTVQSPSAATTFSPSTLASQESGAIGAASIASQMNPQPQKQSAFAQAAKPKPYRVQRGDTLSSIAKANKMSLSQLLKLNPKFRQQAKYKGGNMIFKGTTVNLKKPGAKKPGAFSGMNVSSPAQFRMGEERSMRLLQNPQPQPNQGGFR